MMMSDLPRDLVEEILCRVPATSLKRLRSTCKRWNSLFENINFTRKHFDIAAKQFLFLMLTSSRICTVSVNLDGVPSVEATGELSLIDHRSSSDQFEICEVSYYEGLFLCTNEDFTRIVVWNPCTGQTRWIQLRVPTKKTGTFALGSYQDNKSGSNSYKILCYWGDSKDQKFEIYEFNSDSWRILEATSDCDLARIDFSVSLKGKTYWFASDEKEKQLGIFLLSFDYTTERFGRLSLPCQCPRYQTVSLSAVKGEKISVLLQGENTRRTEIWVTNKIGETKLVSWSMVLAVDLKPELDIWDGLSFLVDEEKKLIVCCDKYREDDEFDARNLVYIVGEDNIVRKVDFGIESSYSWPFLFTYVPSLTQIQQGLGSKRKRDEQLSYKRQAFCFS